MRGDMCGEVIENYRKLWSNFLSDHHLYLAKFSEF